MVDGGAVKRQRGCFASLRIAARVGEGVSWLTGVVWVTGLAGGASAWYEGCAPQEGLVSTSTSSSIGGRCRVDTDMASNQAWVTLVPLQVHLKVIDYWGRRPLAVSVNQESSVLLHWTCARRLAALTRRSTLERK
jgi:hypothetical protein